MEAPLGLEDLPEDMRRIVLALCSPCDRLALALANRSLHTAYPFNLGYWQPQSHYLLQGETHGVRIGVGLDGVSTRAGFSIACAEAGYLHHLVL